MKKSVKSNSNKKKNKLDYVTEFWKKWWAYLKANEDWILALDRLGLSSISHYEWLTDDTAFHKFEETLKKDNVKWPDFPTLHQEVTDTAIPILEFLFGPNEVPLIPNLPSWCPGGWDEWCEKKRPIEDEVTNRIMGARNKIKAAELKTKAKIIPRSGWSSPYPITHWAKVFNISRKTMQNWLENNQIIARKIGSKWRIAIEELPATDDQDSSQ